MTDLFSEGDRDACSREATAAIEAILDQRCPEMKITFWNAVEKLYRPGPQSDGARPVPPGPIPDAESPARSR